MRLLVGQIPVADSGLGENVPGMFRAGLEFSVQLPHIHPQIFDVIGVRRPPHVGQNTLVSAVGRQIGQQVELGGGQLDFIPIPRARQGQSSMSRP